MWFEKLTGFKEESPEQVRSKPNLLHITKDQKVNLWTIELCLQ